MTEFGVDTAQALHLRGRAAEAPYIHACFRAHFVDGRDLADDALLDDIVRSLGEDVVGFRAALAAPAVKQRLAEETETAFARGVFGAPTFFFGDEMFWGNDRLALLEATVAAARRQRGAHG